MERQRLKEVLSQFPGKRILVLGDLMLDEYIWGSVSRISPEAPVPVVEVKSRSFRPGGAGNVAASLQALGAEVLVVSVIGEDETGRELLAQLESLGINTEGVIADRNRPTIRKTRVVAHSQQVVRIDEEDRGKLNDAIGQQMAEEALRGLDDAHALLISDYDKGTVTQTSVAPAIEKALANGRIVAVDAKPQNFPLFHGITLISPNQAEAGLATGIQIVDQDSLAQAGKTLLEQLAARSVLITRGEHGMSLFCQDGRTAHIPAVASEVYDVTGAGDTVIACATLALAAGAEEEEAAHLSNYAAAVVVKKVGTATANPQEIEASIAARSQEDE